MPYQIGDHPGHHLAELLEALQLRPGQLAKALGTGPMRIHDILKLGRAITPDTALRLGTYFSTGAQYWLILQNEYELFEARRKLGDQGVDLADAITPLSHTHHLPIVDLQAVAMQTRDAQREHTVQLIVKAVELLEMAIPAARQG